MSIVHLHIPGHGGINPKYGTYFTNPTWSKDNPDTWHKMHYYKTHDFVVYEGVVNRHIVENIMIQANLAGIECVNLVPEFDDITLQERVNRVNNWFHYLNSIGKKCVLWEHHNNWWSKESASGYECYSSTRTNFSDKMSKIFLEEMAQEFPHHINRGEKEANFYVIQNSPAYGVLIEWGFMSNWKSAKELYSTTGYKKMSKVMLGAMKRVEEVYK